MPSTEAFREDPNIYSHLNSVLEGMSILQSQMVALTTSSKAMQLVLECRLVEMENRLKDGRADDLRAIFARLSDIANAALLDPASTYSHQRSFRSQQPATVDGSWKQTTSSSPVPPAMPRARPQGSWAQQANVGNKAQPDQRTEQERGMRDGNYHTGGGCWSALPPPRSRRSSSPSPAVVAPGAVATAVESAGSVQVPTRMEIMDPDGGTCASETRAAEQNAAAVAAGKDHVGGTTLSWRSDEIVPFDRQDSIAATMLKNGDGDHEKNGGNDGVGTRTTPPYSPGFDEGAPASTVAKSGGPGSGGVPRVAWTEGVGGGSPLASSGNRDRSTQMMRALSVRARPAGGRIGSLSSSGSVVSKQALVGAGSGTAASLPPSARRGSVGEVIRPQIEEVGLH